MSESERKLEKQMLANARGLANRHSGQLIAFAWPGGYPIVYTDNWGGFLCPKCANENLQFFNSTYRDELTGRFVSPFDLRLSKDLPNGFFIHYEGPQIYCDSCNYEIESSFGDPENPEGGEN